MGLGVRLTIEIRALCLYSLVHLNGPSLGALMKHLCMGASHLHRGFLLFRSIAAGSVAVALPGVKPFFAAWKERGLWKASSNLSELEFRDSVSIYRKTKLSSCVVSRLSCPNGSGGIHFESNAALKPHGLQLAGSGPCSFDSTGRHRPSTHKFNTPTQFALEYCLARSPRC